MALGLLGAATFPGSALAATVRIGVAPPLPHGAALQARRPVAGALALTVALRPKDPAALARYAAAVSDPDSSSYRRYVTAAQFANRFAPAPATIAAVDRALRRAGLRPRHVSANHLAIPVHASARQVQRAFSVKLARVRLAGGHEVLINTTAPAVGAHVAHDIQAILGLNGTVRATTDFARGRRAPAQRPPGPIFTPWLSIGAGSAPQPLPHIASGGPQPCGAVLKAASPQEWGPAWTTDQIADAYGFAPLYQKGDFGQGITIAVYEDEPNLHSDITAYERCYRIDARVSYVKVGKGNGNGPGSGEATMDIDQLVGLAPEAHVIVYDGPNSTDGSTDAILNRIVSDDTADVISDSWGECEPDDGRQAARVDDTLLQEAAVQGQTFVIAAGDDGAQDCYEPGVDKNKQLEVDEPASDPWATGVGGTLLSKLNPFTEQPWNDRLSGTVKELGKGGAGAGGGGVSQFWKMPDYQLDAPSTLNVVQPDSSVGGCAQTTGYCREVPDVSANADPADGYMSYFDGPSKKSGGWQSVGGTSDSAPLWAALFALADDQPGCAQTDVGFANPLLYELAAQSQSTYFHDVTTGNNDFAGNSGALFPAGPGYDMATGLGSPNAAALAPALCAAEPRLARVPNESLKLGQTISLQLQATLPGSGGTSTGTTTAPTTTTTVPSVTTTTPTTTTSTTTTTPSGTPAVTYKQSGLPTGVRLNATTGLASGAPTRPGTYYVYFWIVLPNGALSNEVWSKWTVAS